MRRSNEFDFFYMNPCHLVFTNPSVLHKSNIWIFLAIIDATITRYHYRMARVCLFPICLKTFKQRAPVNFNVQSILVA